MTDPDATPPVAFTCTAQNGVEASTASGTIPSGTYTLPHTFSDGVEALTFNNCTGPLGDVTATPNPGSLPYDITIVQQDPNDPDQWWGYISDVDVHVSMSGCEFDVTGNAPGYYDNSEHTLVMTPNVPLPSGVQPLTISNVVGCFGIVHNGDNPTYEGDYVITDPVNPSITITKAP